MPLGMEAGVGTICTFTGVTSIHICFHSFTYSLVSTLIRFFFTALVYAALGGWTPVLTLSFAPFGHSGRNIHAVIDV